ncbi:hypothetical protein ABVF11_02655 [Pediococcus argentinicus]|uniref:hypothetical protein n=1 Tax=Pediococcus argentinicus TaxID=480391 RepID=UPI00338DEE10
MLIKLLTSLFALIILFVGYYLYSHRQTDFMLFKPSSNPVLSGVLKNTGRILIGIAILCFILGLMGNTYLVLAALFIGMIATTSVLLTLMRFM